jgi:predicted lipoprotein with Yx(FWY)xxD motif
MIRASATVAALAAAAVALPVTAGAHSGAASAGALVQVAYNKQLKKSILVDAHGITLYGWTNDASSKPTCYNDPTYHCSKAWPPLLTEGAPRAGRGVKASLLRVVKRHGGGLQVTYRGHPLYTDAGATSFGLVADKKPGDVRGLGFAGLWFALSPSGAKIGP